MAAVGAYIGSFVPTPSLFRFSVTVVLPVRAAAPSAAVRFVSAFVVSHVAAVGAYIGDFVPTPSLFCPTVPVVLPVKAAAPSVAVRFDSDLRV